jgi:hypothetical protein
MVARQKRKIHSAFFATHISFFRDCIVYANFDRGSGWHCAFKDFRNSPACPKKIFALVLIKGNDLDVCNCDDQL